MDPLNPLVCHANLLLDMLGGVADKNIPGKLTTFREAITVLKEHIPYWYKDSYYAMLLDDVEHGILQVSFRGSWDCFCLANNLRFRIKKEWRLYFS
ncbi:MAG: hypothetical protein IMZ61_16010 [Planctomycetes bacterium]|nr:hypothetical protein [Planctomycetota bacterium]